MSRFGRLINAGFGRCKHRVLGTCVDAADGCCAGVACAICVKLLDGYGEVVDGVSLAWDGTGYSGSVGGFSFESYWLDNYGACEFHVIISAGGYIEPIHIIKTKGDYTDAACCMNPGGETEVDDGTDTYTMTWGPVDPLILARRLVSEGCYERFCGDCDCAPRKLCLQVVSDDCSVAKIISLAENYADPDCPLPVWDLDFTCGTFSFSGQLALVRDEYTGGCILQMSGTRGGAVDEESHDFAITDCAALSATFLLTEDYVDYLITISPADCDACNPPKHQTACCIAPLPPVLYGKLINDVNAGCMEAAGIITLNWTAEDPTPSNQFGFGNGGGWIGSAALPCVQAGVVCVKFWCQLVTSTGKPTNDDCLSFAAQVDTGCGPTTPVCLTLSGGTINGNAGPTATDGCDCTDPDEEVEMLYVRFTIALSDPGCTQNPINGFHLEVAENPLDLP